MISAVTLNQGGHVKGLRLNPGILARHHWGSYCHERSPGDRQKLGNVCLVKRHHWPSSSMYRFTTFIKLHRDQYIDHCGNTHLNDTFQGQTDFEEKPWPRARISTEYLLLWSRTRSDLLILFLYKKHKYMTQRKWGIHMQRKIKKLNWIPICPPIRSSHHFSPGLICQLPIQSKHSRRNPTWTNGMSLWMCLFIHRVRWNTKTAASNWFSVKEQTVTEKRRFPRHSWMHPAIELFPCWQGLHQDFSLANARLSCRFRSGLLQTTHWNTPLTENYNSRKTEAQVCPEISK